MLNKKYKQEKDSPGGIQTQDLMVTVLMTENQCAKQALVIIIIH